MRSFSLNQNHHVSKSIKYNLCISHLWPLSSNFIQKPEWEQVPLGASGLIVFHFDVHWFAVFLLWIYKFINSAGFPVLLCYNASLWIQRHASLQVFSICLLNTKSELFKDQDHQLFSQEQHFHFSICLYNVYYIRSKLTIPFKSCSNMN